MLMYLSAEGRRGEDANTRMFHIGLAQFLADT